jgi:hypothetical protein
LICQTFLLKFKMYTIHDVYQSSRKCISKFDNCQFDLFMHTRAGHLAGSLYFMK